ncbi:HlyD family secretion protein [Algivirga pacifica]|uniref:Cyclolysin T1SS periplasmic adaptor subunit CyaD n=1 Tax=Algivirga pacifica TaxID=1162670 RepID=A0ABP9CYE6_9BACT
MEKSLPSELLPFTVQYLKGKNRRFQHIIYWLILLTIGLALIALPLVSVTVSVNAPGIIRSSQERQWLKAAVDGKVKEVYVRENQTVQKGTLLLVIDHQNLEERIKLLTFKQEELQEQLLDLQNLLSIQLLTLTAERLPVYTWHTIEYQEAAELLHTRLRAIQTQREQAITQYRKDSVLHRSSAITTQQLMKSRIAMEQLRVKQQIQYREQQAEWKRLFKQLQNQQKEQETELFQLDRQRQLYHIKAEQKGTVQDLQALYKGAFITRGQNLIMISPDQELIVENMVPSKDIALIQKGMPVICQIEAYNHHQWGTVEGKVVEVYEDAIFSEGKVFFKVKCQLQQKYLQLSGKYQGHLKKGMTLNTRFVVAERTLFQLLYDKVDDWMNPIHHH